MSATEDEMLYADFYETVVLSYVEYETARNKEQFGTRSDWKAAMAAASAAYHFREHLTDRHKKSHTEIVGLCADHALWAMS